MNTLILPKHVAERRIKQVEKEKETRRKPLEKMSLPKRVAWWKEALAEWVSDHKPCWPWCPAVRLRPARQISPSRGGIWPPRWRKLSCGMAISRIQPWSTSVWSLSVPSKLVAISTPSLCQGKWILLVHSSPPPKAM